MASNVTIAKQPDHTGTVRVDFWNPEFDVLVWDKGYLVTWEEAVRCPCTERYNSAKSSCNNCMGTGWFFINPVQTKAVIQSINFSTKFKHWSENELGTASLTIENRFQLAFMDRITVIDSYSINTEVHVLKEYIDANGQSFIYTMVTYKIVELLELFKYNSPTVAHQKVPLSNFSVDGYKILFGAGYSAGDIVTVRYKHPLCYHVIDTPHDVRNSYLLDNDAKEVQNKLPINAIIRHAHYVLDKPDFEGTNVIDNSYVVPDTKC